MLTLLETRQMGRYRLGEYVALPCATRNASSVVAAPDAAPQVSIYAADGTEAIADQKVPPLNVGQTTGLFQWNQLLDSNFSTGKYTAYFSYAISATNFASLCLFEVIGGGNDDGPYIAMHYFHRSEADFIIGQREDGTRDIRRNPYVA